MMLFDFLIICDNNENTIEDTILSVLEQAKRHTSKVGKVFVVDNGSTDSSWEVISKIIRQERVANSSSMFALRNEYKVSDLQVLLAYIPMAAKNSFVGIIKNSVLCDNVLDYVNAYVNAPAEVVGVLYGDYIKKYGDISVNIHQFSFDTKLPTLDQTTFINSEVLKKVSIKNEQNLMDLYKAVSSQFLAIHVPQILTVER